MSVSNIETGPTEMDESKRESIPTEKAKENIINRLLTQRKTTLTQVTKQCNKLRSLMDNYDNIHLVKTEHEKLKMLIEQFESNHSAYHGQMLTTDDIEASETWYMCKKDNIGSFEERLSNWLANAETKIHADIDRHSRSSKSGASKSSASSTLAKERAKVAELKMEKSFSEQRMKIKQLEIDMEIAKAEAREKAISEVAHIDIHPQNVQITDPPPLPPVLELSAPKPQFTIQPEAEPFNPPPGICLSESRPPPDVMTVADNVSKGGNYDSVNTMINLQREQNNSMLFTQQQLAAAMSLPQPEIPKFTGDPTEYIGFMNAFISRVDAKVTAPSDKLYYLHQHLVGDSKELIESCLYMDPIKGYNRAKELLDKEYGDPYKVSVSYVNKVVSWPVIKPDDCQGLRKFSLFLLKCVNAMDNITYLSVLEHPPNMQKIVQKLPLYLQDKWREKVVNMRVSYRRIASFHDLTAFIQLASESANDPIFSRQALSTLNPVVSKSGKSGLQVKKSYHSQNRHNNVSLATDISSEENNVAQSNSLQSCPLCSKSHDLDDCNVFLEKTMEDRRQFLKSKFMCFGCYGKGHMSKGCYKKRTCTKCKKKHPTALHIEGFKWNQTYKKSDTQNSNSDDTIGTGSTSVCNTVKLNSVVLHAILPVKIMCPKSNVSIKTYAFYDNGSSGCFVSDSVKQQLKVDGIETKLLLGTMHGKSYVDSIIVDGLIVTDVNGDNPIQLPRTYTRDYIPVSHDQIPTKEMVEKWDHLSDIACQIPDVNEDLEIGVLIGSNCPKALEPQRVKTGNGTGPYATLLRHGWTINGPSQIMSNIESGCINVHRLAVMEVQQVKEVLVPGEILKLLESDFKDTSITPDDHGLSQNDKKFLNIVSCGIQQKDNHFEIPLPFKHNEVMMPNNKIDAVKRCYWQKKKMMKNDKYRNDYVKFVNDLIDKGYSEEVPKDELNTKQGKVWYIPHHGVYHPKKPEKIRVVFDCSSKFHGTSLNDQLLCGPDMTNSLVGVMTRFRQEPVAFMSDIEAMFHQVQVPTEHRDYLRFLWWENGDLSTELKEYRMTVHLFGAVSSPSCSNYALKETANRYEDVYGILVADTIRKNFYVDDCLRSVGTKEFAIQLIDALRKNCNDGGFHLTKFICNDRTVLESIPVDERSKEVKSLDLANEDLPIERALGVQWLVEYDTFGFKVNVKDKPMTRRGILSTVSSVYDPLGFVAPFIIPAKKLLQDLCRENLGWDDEVSEVYQNRLENWKRELPLLESFQVKRCLKPSDFGTVISHQLHIFSDASYTGYGAVAYLRSCNENEEVHCSFLMGKARLAPIKAMTVPRLELTAATVGVRMGCAILKELEFKPDDIFYYTDSMTVLRYIANEDKRFHVFVSNRVQTIRDYSAISQWRYVDTKLNPADIASRGLSGQALLECTQWLHGPAFLWKPEKDWPEFPKPLNDLSDTDPEVKTGLSNVTDVSYGAMNKMIEYFSDWYRLKKAVAVYQRLFSILQQQRPFTRDITRKWSASFTVNDLMKAESAIIKFTQKQSFPSEFHELSSDKDRVQSQLKEKRFSSLWRLDPFLDDDHILCVGGRLSRAVIPEEMKHPAILPHRSHVTMLLIRHIHNRLGHAGRCHVLAELRNKYWIIGANSAVRHYISQCVRCRRSRGELGQQKMADLPANRLTPGPPFTYVGVDYFGPFVVKEGRKELKRYGAIFTCLVSRAIHIETSISLETDSFLNALRRFIARRGPVKEIRCDNGTNFVGARRELKEAFKELDHSKVQNSMHCMDIDWLFNPPSASHMGGVWERQIRTVRKVLNSLMIDHAARLDDESFRTLMCEVEAIVNSRPLTFVSNDVDDFDPLTPNHLLTTKSNVYVPPPGVFQRNDVYMRRRWRRVQYLANLFWSRWRKEYLHTLQIRSKWLKPKPNLQVNDIVLLCDESIPRNIWPMGRVVKVEQDSKNLVRSVIVKTATSELRRPIHKLVLLLSE